MFPTSSPYSKAKNYKSKLPATSNRTIEQWLCISYNRIERNKFRSIRILFESLSTNYSFPKSVRITDAQKYFLPAGPRVESFQKGHRAADQPGEEFRAARRIAAQIVGGRLARLIGADLLAVVLCDTARVRP